jgi:hypothetical protein
MSLFLLGEGGWAAAGGECASSAQSPFGCLSYPNLLYTHFFMNCEQTTLLNAAERESAVARMKTKDNS